MAIKSALIGNFEDRAIYAIAKLEQLKLPFNQWLDAETFNIAMQSCFVDEAAADGKELKGKSLVLKYISSVKAVSESSVSDNGAAQAVEVKSGIASKAVSLLPNPVTLRPFRTFTEVEQPESDFIFRCRSENGKMQFTLVEADGGAWRSIAMKNIKDFMGKSAPNLRVIA